VDPIVIQAEINFYTIAVTRLDMADSAPFGRFRGLERVFVIDKRGIRRAMAPGGNGLKENRRSAILMILLPQAKGQGAQIGGSISYF
jgi:hypothetical protein